tara:strand:+ start:1134 stop:1985 length:852 start_codon:yes stop_codon:yes gene_type:complete
MRYFLTSIFLFFVNFSWSDCSIAKDSSKTVIAGGSLTEVVYFLEQEQKIIGVDITSNFPPETSALPSIGYVRALSTEGILSLKPTLILGEDDMGPPLVVEQLSLTGLDVRILGENHSSSGILEKIECLSEVLNTKSEDTLSKIDLIRDDINFLDDLAQENRESGIKVMLILNMQGTSPIVAGMGTSGDGFIKMTGASNAADKFEGWKPISSESIISYNPDYIIITNRGMSSFPDIESLASTTSLKFTNAARDGKILSEDGMAMLGFGTRTVSTAIKFAKIFSE